jgi:hypothetical protein
VPCQVLLHQEQSPACPALHQACCQLECLALPALLLLALWMAQSLAVLHLISCLPVTLGPACHLTLMQHRVTRCHQAVAQDLAWVAWLLALWTLWAVLAWEVVWAVWAVVWVEWVDLVPWVWEGQVHLVLGLQVVWVLPVVLVAAYWQGGRLLHLLLALWLLLQAHC